MHVYLYNYVYACRYALVCARRVCALSICHGYPLLHWTRVTRRIMTTSEAFESYCF